MLRGERGERGGEWGGVLVGSWHGTGERRMCRPVLSEVWSSRKEELAKKQRLASYRRFNEHSNWVVHVVVLVGLLRCKVLWNISKQANKQNKTREKGTKLGG